SSFSIGYTAVTTDCNVSLRQWTALSAISTGKDGSAARRRRRAIKSACIIQNSFNDLLEVV
ncbi:MAG: hypothetical protein JFR24_06310, partial [Muribaculaceae bacterium]|nr:hypothetical protein [Muribaculaceae bacterium]